MNPMTQLGRMIDVGGIATHYHDAGDGPVLLLLHGSGPGVDAYANWRLIVPELSQDYRVIAPDMLGFGHTESPSGTSYNLTTWLQHLTRFLDTLHIEQCSVIGNSFGGALALHFALQHPKRIDKLILMGSVGVSFELTPGLDAAWGYTPSPQAMRELLQLFAYRDGLVGDDLVEARYQASVRPAVKEAYSAMFPPPRQRSVDALALTDDELAMINCETLLVHGREDRIIPVSVSVELAERLPRTRLHVFDECGHWVQIEMAQEFCKLAQEFLGPVHDTERPLGPDSRSPIAPISKEHQG